MSCSEVDGYAPEIFGPPLWHFLHLLSFAYPEYVDDYQLKQKVYNFFVGLGTVLPCSACRDHYQQNLSGLERSLNSRNDLSHWVYDLHNKVNAQIGVPRDRWPSYQAVRDKYMALKNPDPEGTVCTDTCPNGTGLRCVVETVPKDLSEGFGSAMAVEKEHAYIAVIVILVLLVVILFCILASQRL